jgi:hypothetical protein
MRNSPHPPGLWFSQRAMAPTCQRSRAMPRELPSLNAGLVSFAAAISPDAQLRIA